MTTNRDRRAPLIGVTSYGRDEKNQFHLPAEYLDAVRRAGGIPLLLAPGETRLDEVFDRIDGLILTGGGDLDPNHYEGEAHETVYNVDSERDAMELEMARRVLAHPMPILGICRGTQVLNVAHGGSLHEHLPDVVGDDVAHRAPPREPIPHDVTVREGSRLAAILGACEFTCASWHHQAVDIVAAEFDVVAHAPDGTIEAMEHRSHRWLFAVQWHPELTAAKDPMQQRIFDALIDAAGENP